MLKKILIGSIVSGLLLTSVAAYAASKPETPKAPKVTIIQKNDEMKTMANGKAVSLQELDEQSIMNIAKKMGIDTQGLTKEQIVEKLKETKVKIGAKDKTVVSLDQLDEQGLMNVAKKMGIDTTGLTKEQIIEKVKEAKVSIVKNKKPVKSIDDLDEQELMNVAKKMGIDATGLTKEQIIQKIKDSKQAIISKSAEK